MPGHDNGCAPRAWNPCRSQHHVGTLADRGVSRAPFVAIALGAARETPLLPAHCVHPHPLAPLPSPLAALAGRGVPKTLRS